jgi:hypothetical protein
MQVHEPRLPGRLNSAPYQSQFSAHEHAIHSDPLRVEPSKPLASDINHKNNAQNRRTYGIIENIE